MRLPHVEDNLIHTLSKGTPLRGFESDRIRYGSQSCYFHPHELRICARVPSRNSCIQYGWSCLGLVSSISLVLALRLEVSHLVVTICRAVL
jgi:hypothetical protein